MSLRMIPVALVLAVLLVPSRAGAQYPPDVLTTLYLARAPVSISCDDGGGICAVDRVETARYTADLGLIKAWGNNGGVLCAPFAVAAEDADYCYVIAALYSVSCGQPKIHRFTKEGQHLNWFCGGGAATPCVAVALAASPYGGLYAVNKEGSSIWAFDSSGQPTAGWSTGVSQGGTNPPSPDLAVGDDGSIFLSVPGAGTIVIFGPTGARYEAWSGSRYPTVQRPQAIDVAPDGSVYVFDGRRETIQRYAADGTFLYEWSHPGLNGALAVDEEGYVYAGTTAGIVKFDNHSAPEPLPERLDPHEGAILLHVGPAAGTELGCEGLPDEPEEIVTKGLSDALGGVAYYVYVMGSPSTLKSKDDGLTGLQFALEYTVGDSSAGPISVLGWQPCSVLDFPQDNWPKSGTGNTIVWTANPSTCQRRDLVVAGYFYVVAHSPITLSVVGYPATGLGKVADCSGAEVNLSADRLGWVSFGGAQRFGVRGGCNPLVVSCARDDTPVRPVTWGRLKTLYE